MEPRRTKRTLQDVRRELVKARVADAVAVSLSLRRWWHPVLWYRSLWFLYKNRRRQKILAEMNRKSMGFDWRDSRPKKLQRQLGILPPVNT